MSKPHTCSFNFKSCKWSCRCEKRQNMQKASFVTEVKYNFSNLIYEYLHFYCQRYEMFLPITFKMLLQFSDIIHRNSLVQFAQIFSKNKGTYTNTLRRLGGAIRRKRSEKWRNNWFSFTTMLQHTGQI